jgi:hypothetical protein
MVQQASALVFDLLRVNLAAQDPFEIDIYEYEPMGIGQYSLEAHLNTDLQGTSVRDGRYFRQRTRPTSRWNLLSDYRRASPLDSCS